MDGHQFHGKEGGGMTTVKTSIRVPKAIKTRFDRARNKSGATTTWVMCQAMQRYADSVLGKEKGKK